MARMTFDFPEGITEILQKAGDISPACDQMVEAMADVWVEKVKARLAHHKRTGALEESACILTKVHYIDGCWATCGFDDVDKKGISNDLKANYIEHGKRGKKKGKLTPDPFMTKALNDAQPIAERRAAEILEKFLAGGD